MKTSLNVLSQCGSQRQSKPRTPKNQMMSDNSKKNRFVIQWVTLISATETQSHIKKLDCFGMRRSLSDRKRTGASVGNWNQSHNGRNSHHVQGHFAFFYDAHWAINERLHPKYPRIPAVLWRKTRAGIREWYVCSLCNKQRWIQWQIEQIWPVPRPILSI